MSTFFVKRTVAGSYVVDDLGLTIPNGVEKDLALSFDLQTLSQSADLAAALTSGALLRTVSAGGAVIPSGEAFNDNDLPAHIDQPYAHHPHANKAVIDGITDAGSGIIISAAERSKLGGIEAGATGDQTPAEILSALQGLSQPLALGVTNVSGATAAQLRDRNTHTGTQTAATISDFATAADARITAQKGAASGLATLDGAGKIPTAQIPASALPTFTVVANAAARLALTVQEGDEAYQSDDGSQWVYGTSSWFQRPVASGDVIGPGSATADAIVLFNGTTGKIIKNGGVLLSALVPTSRQVIGGNGLTGTGALTGDVTLNVGATDASIDVGVDGVRVGVLQTDAQHGDLGGGTLHALAVAGGAAGFISGADQLKLNGITAGGEPSRLRQTPFAELLANTTTTQVGWVSSLCSQPLTIAAGSALLIQFTASLSNATANQQVYVRIQVDGVTVRGAGARAVAVSQPFGVAMTLKHTGLAPGAHTVTVQWRVSGGTAQCRPVAAPDQEFASLLLTEVTA